MFCQLEAAESTVMTCFKQNGTIAKSPKNFYKKFQKMNMEKSF